MSERYFITGVQVGIIKALCEIIIKRQKVVNKEIYDIKKIIDEVEDKQFFGSVKNATT